MYLNYYNLRLKPFQITTDPRFIWLGEKHNEALATLIYGIQEDKGFLVLTGEIGTGKTTLINCLIKKLDYKVINATISDPDMSTNDFFKILSEEFNIGKNFDGKGDFLIHFKKFLINTNSDEKKVLLIIDEAQRLNHDLLEQIRLLSNIEVSNAKLINIFFVGQNEFNDILMDEKSTALLQRISVRCNIDPLTATETKEFIKHRLKVAGTNEEIFSGTATDEIYLFSQGYPRLINILCDRAMLTSYVNGKRVIDKKTITECAEELRIQSAKSDNGNTDRLVAEKLESRTFIPLQNRRSWIEPLIATSIVALLLSTGLTFLGVNSKATKTSSQETVLSDAVDKTKHHTITPISQSLSGKVETNKHLDSRLDKKQLYDLEISHAKSKISDVDYIIPKNNATKHKPFSENNLVIQFDLDSSELPNKAIEKLDQLADFLINSSGAKIRIIGYTDSTGDYDYNLSVSKLRADKIKSYLLSKGADPLNIKTLGLGSENPIANNATLKGRRKNRRVEIEFDDQFENHVYNKRSEIKQKFYSDLYEDPVTTKY